MSVKGKSVIVTGAASGIGQATALRLGEEGARVQVTDLDGAGAERVAGTVRSRGGEAVGRSLDVTSEDQWEAAVEAVVEEWESLDLLVANAGISHAAPLTETSLSEWRRIHEVNLDGLFLGLKHGVRAMRESTRGGRIVVVSSASGMKAVPGAAAYCSSKAAGRVLARSVALECAADGIRVNTVVPAGVITPMWEAMPFFQELVRERGSEAAAWEALAAGTPLGRFADPDEIASAILFLCSDEADYMTGAELVVDGGYLA